MPERSMNGQKRLSVAAILCVFWLAGCPFAPLGDDSAGTGGATPGTSGGDSSSDGSTATGGSASSGTDLEDRFPGCREPLLADDWRAEVLQLVNDQRSANGVDPLAHDATLEAQAEQYACEMIFYDFFAHENPVTGTQLQDRAAEFGYEYTYIGENLAAGQRSPAEVVRSWMLSAGHRRNILDSGFVEVGVGVRTGGEYNYYWVLEFGSPR